MIRHATLFLCAMLFALPAWTQDASPADDLANRLLLQGILKPSDMRREEPRKVGKLGRIESLIFEGLKTFPEEEVREALARDFDVLLAGHVEAPLEDYLKALEQRLTEAYRKHGFPQIQVTAAVRTNEKKILVTVDEGEKYQNGEVKVEGSRKIDAKSFARFLTDSEAHVSPGQAALKRVMPVGSKQDSTPKLFQAGETADFFNQPAEVYEEVIKAAFAAQGFFFPQFEAELKPAAENKADLWIHIQDPGPKATIGQITVTGNRHHSPEQIIEFLGIKPGQQVDARRIEAWEQTLLQSHCFLESQVIVLPAIAPDAPSELLVRVVDQPQGPRLGDQLTAQDKLLVKTAQWMSRWHEGHEGDCVATFRQPVESGEVRLLLILSPNEGLVMDVEFLPDEKSAPIRYTVVLHERNARLVSWHRNCFLEQKEADRHIDGWIAFHFAEKKDEPGSWALNFGPRLRLGNGSADQPFQFGFEITPATAIGVARDPGRTVRQTDGMLEIAKGDAVTRIDAGTGRLVAIVPKQSKTQLADVKKATVPQLEKNEGFLYFQEGAFDRFLKNLERETQAFAPAYNPQRPVSSLVEFVLSEAMQFGELARQEPSLEVLIKLVQLDALQPLDRLCVEKHSPGVKPESFHLTLSSKSDLKFFGLENRIPFGMGQEFGPLVFSLHRLLVPPESGPARVGWNAALLCAGRSQEAVTNLERLPQSPEVGPMTCWYAGRLFGRLSKPLGHKFAEAGLKKLNEDQFRYEMDHLLPEESLLFELVGSLGNAVRQLDDDEFAQLTLLLGEQAKHPAVPKLIEKIRQEKGKPSRHLMLDSLVTLWTIRGQALVRDHLEKLAQETKPEIDLKKVTLDSLFPNKGSKDKKADETPATKTQKRWHGEFRPLVIQ